MYALFAIKDGILIEVRAGCSQHELLVAVLSNILDVAVICRIDHVNTVVVSRERLSDLIESYRSLLVLGVHRQPPDE